MRFRVKSFIAGRTEKLGGLLFFCVADLSRLDASHSGAVKRARHTGLLPFGRTQPGAMASRERPHLAAICQVRNHDNLYTTFPFCLLQSAGILTHTHSKGDLKQSILLLFFSEVWNWIWDQSPVMSWKTKASFSSSFKPQTKLNNCFHFPR